MEFFFRILHKYFVTKHEEEIDSKKGKFIISFNFFGNSIIFQLKHTKPYVSALEFIDWILQDFSSFLDCIYIFWYKILGTDKFKNGKVMFCMNIFRESMNIPD